MERCACYAGGREGSDGSFFQFFGFFFFGFCRERKKNDGTKIIKVLLYAEATQSNARKKDKRNQVCVRGVVAQRTKPLQPAAGVFLFSRDFLEIIFFRSPLFLRRGRATGEGGFVCLLFRGCRLLFSFVFLLLVHRHQCFGWWRKIGSEIVREEVVRCCCFFPRAGEKNVFFPPASGGGPGPLAVAAGGGVELHQVRPVFLLFRQGRKRRPRRRRRRQPEALEE